MQVALHSSLFLAVDVELLGALVDLSAQACACHCGRKSKTERVTSDGASPKPCTHQSAVWAVSTSNRPITNQLNRDIPLRPVETARLSACVPRELSGVSALANPPFVGVPIQFLTDRSEVTC